MALVECEMCGKSKDTMICKECYDDLEATKDELENLVENLNVEIEDLNKQIENLHVT